MRLPARTSCLERFDFGEFPQRKAYIVESFEQSPGGVIVNSERHHHCSGGDIPILKIHSDFQPWILLDQLPEEFDIILGDFGRQQSGLARVAAKDIGESGRDDHPEPVVHQCPHRMLARRSGTEIGPGD